MFRFLFFGFVLIHSSFAKKSADNSTKTWLTLDGTEPIVIARGGFSGLFPESSQYANDFAMSSSLSNLVLFCNLQMTKDEVGICQTDLRLDNATNIEMIFPNSSKTYNVYGQDLTGWFPLDFTTDQLFNNVSLEQSIFSRTDLFNDQLLLSSVEDVGGIKGSTLWLNVQYDMFYSQHKLSPAAFIQAAQRYVRFSYISSPEIGFFKSISKKVNTAKTKLIFQFLSADSVEPTTKKKYSEILKDLSSIKSYASGILVPKDYIWPVNKDNYLTTPTSLVNDAHKVGLEVYASGFANDMPGSYNYSYNPVLEYLQFIDNSKFSVDGVLTDFPPTASEAIACFAQNNVTKPRKGAPLVISHNGASGVYPGCTDLSYQQAVEDGADIIDCSVQMTKDGVPFCLDSVDLTGDSNAITTFMSKSSMIPEIQKNSGIFSFDLTWSEIQTLTPQLTSPMSDGGFMRNPAAKNKGKFWTLAEFLDFAKTKAVSGVLINIQNAAYLASKKGLSITDAVTKALSNATFDKQSTQKVLIQSDDTSVLSTFKSVPTYQRVLLISEIINNVPKESVTEIKKYADAVNILRACVITIVSSFTFANTSVIQDLHAANISVYVQAFRNEYVTIPFDLFSDPMVELATYTAGLGADGVITDYPATAAAYIRTPCSDLSLDQPQFSILPAQPGSVLGLLQAEGPVAAPQAPLVVADIVDPPLPAVSNVTSIASPSVPAPTVSPKASGGFTNVANLGVSMVAGMVISLFCLGF